MTPLRVTVLGSGSVGLAIAASCAQAGQGVTLLARGAAVPLPRQDGIAVTGASRCPLPRETIHPAIDR